MEIEEGDMVVTPEPEIREYVEAVMKGAEMGYGWTVEEACVAVDSPIRVRVSRQSEAEQLVELAREFDWNIGNGNPKTVKYFEFVPNGKKLFSIEHDDFDHDLTFEDDYKQIKAWIEYHGESEDECETCGGSGVVERWPDLPVDITFSCPDCPEDTDSANNAQTEVSEKTDNDTVSGKSYNESKPTIRYLLNHIDNLEQELEQVRQKRDELWEKLKQIEKVMNIIMEVDCYEV